MKKICISGMKGVSKTELAIKSLEKLKNNTSLTVEHVEFKPNIEVLADLLVGGASKYAFKSQTSIFKDLEKMFNTSPNGKDILLYDISPLDFYAMCLCYFLQGFLSPNEFSKLADRNKLLMEREKIDIIVNLNLPAEIYVEKIKSETIDDREVDLNSISGLFITYQMAVLQFLKEGYTVLNVDLANREIAEATIVGLVKQIEEVEND